MPRKRTKRADGRYEIKRKMPDGKYKHFLGDTVAEATAKYEEAYRQATLEESKNNSGATFREMAIAYLLKKWTQAHQRESGRSSQDT